MRHFETRRTTGLADVLTSHILLVLTLLLLAQTGPYLWSKDVWLPDEVRHAAVFVQLIENGHWIALQLGDAFYPDKPPLYFWFLAVLHAAIRTTDPVLYMIAAALAAWAYLVVTVWVGRALGFSRTTVLVAGFVLLSNWFFVERAHQPRMDLLFGVFILISSLSFFRAIDPDQTHPERLWTVGFVSAAAAVLVKGPLGAAFPLATLILHLGRHRDLGRLWHPGFWFGAMIFTAIISFYLFTLISLVGVDFYSEKFSEQVWDRMVDAPILNKPVWFYIGQMPVILLPWTLVLPFALLVFKDWRSMASRIWRADCEEHAGKAYLWTFVLSGLLILSALDYKNTFFLVTFLAPAALLLADAFSAMSRARRVWISVAMSTLLVVAATGASLAPNLVEWPELVQGEFGVATALAAAAVLGLSARRADPAIAAGALALGWTVFCIPFYSTTIPGLDQLMSPRETALVLRAEADKGYALAHFSTWNVGEFDYHTARPIAHFRHLPDLEHFIKTRDCVVLAMRDSNYANWVDRPDGAEVLHRARLDVGDNLVLRWSAPHCGAEN